MIYEETLRNHKETQLEAEKTQKKLEVKRVLGFSMYVYIYVQITSAGWQRIPQQAETNLRLFTT